MIYLTWLSLECLTIYKMPVILIIVNTNHGCKTQQRTMET